MYKKRMQATLHSDGGARGNPGPAGVGYVIVFEDGREIAEGDYVGETTNNQAEYRALLAGMVRAKQEGVTDLTCRLDSELVVRQLDGEYRVKDADLKPLHEEVKKIASGFFRVAFEHVPREENTEADALVNEAIDKTLKKM